MKRLMFALTAMMVVAISVAQTTTQQQRPQRPANSVHDPVMIKEGNTYYVLGTGRGVSIITSTNRTDWTRGGSAFAQPLAWWKQDIPKQDGSIWAPDISYRDGKFHMYYSVSAWMDFNSSIGYATNTTLDPKDPNYKWVDHGKVIDFRKGGEGVNCIDPNLFVDSDGRVWLFYGSYKAGLRLVELNAETGMLKNPENPEITVLTDHLGEGVFVIKVNGYYYIFASEGKCCAGIESTYHVVMGRSKDIKGPYLNKKGESWVESKSTMFLEGNYEEPGRGHNGFFTERDTTFIVYHAYTRSAGGASLLNIKPMYMDEEGWPTLTPTATTKVLVAENQQTVINKKK